MEDHPEFADAILIGEPDYVLEAIRYYADNRIYIAREKWFGYTVRFVRSAQLHLSLGELLCAAWRIQERENTPVLLAFGHLTVDQPARSPGAAPQSINYPYRRTFTWSREDLADWRRYAVLQQQFNRNVVGDEVYGVYSVTMPSDGSRPSCKSEP